MALLVCKDRMERVPVDFLGSAPLPESIHYPAHLEDEALAFFFCVINHAATV